MPTVKSLEDLKKIREEALKKREIKSAPGSIQIVVGMGTPGIAAGALLPVAILIFTLTWRSLHAPAAPGWTGPRSRMLLAAGLLTVGR